MPLYLTKTDAPANKGGVCDATWQPFVILVTLVYRSLSLLKCGPWNQAQWSKHWGPRTEGFSISVFLIKILVIHRLHSSCQETQQTVA